MEKFNFKLNEEKFETPNSEITGEKVLKTGSLEPVEDYELLIKIHEKGFEPVRLGEKIDLREPGIEGFFAKPFRKLIIYVDDNPLEMDEAFSTPNRILEKAGKNPDNYFLNQIIDDKEIGYRNDPDYKVAIKNGQKFYSYKRDHLFTIYVNGTPEEWENKKISFKEIVKIAFPNPPYPNTEYQVVYAEAYENTDGTLAEGQEVKIKEGTQFDVTATDKS